MVMTDEQKYSAVLRELGEVLQNKNTTISCQRWQIDELKAKLEAAEKEGAERCKERAIFREINAAILACVNIETREITNPEMLQALQHNIAAALQMEGGAA